MQIEEVIAEFHKLGLPDIKEREVRLPTDTGKAITVIGLRRTGKTYLLYQTMQNILSDSGGPKELREMFYINFEDERLRDMKAENLSEIVEIYRKYNPDSETMYLFLDEIQAVDGWESFVRRLLERRDVRIFITGSSSRLLSREIASSLRGRSLSYTLFPLSFREFLRFKGEDFSGREVLIEDERGRIKAYIEEYMEFGGFPEIVSGMERRDLKIRTLQEYLDLIVYRDLVERYGIEKTGVMKALIKVIVKNFGNRVSISRLNEMLSSGGASISRRKIYEYFSYLEDTGFVIPIKKFSYSAIKSERSMSKLYVIDTGFPTIYGLEDRGRRMENMVAMELLRRKSYRNPGEEIHYYLENSGKEVDFVISTGGKASELIQVSYSVEDPYTKKREVDALIRASEELKCENLTIITWDYEGNEESDGKKINYVPLWKWLLDM